MMDEKICILEKLHLMVCFMNRYHITGCAPLPYG